MRQLLVLLLAAGAFAAEEATPLLHHDIAARLAPDQHLIEVRDTLSGMAWKGPVRFRLHAGLTVSSADPAAYRVKALDKVEGGAVPQREYALAPVSGKWAPDAKVTLLLRGKIYHPLKSEEQEYARSFSRTPGIISEKGVMLSGASAWLPSFGEGLLTFTLAVDLPAEWDAVSQGRRTVHATAGGRRKTTWECVHPSDDVYLIAARFTEYSRSAGDVLAEAFLREPDPNLAAKYLEVTAQYIAMYRKLIGPYPFSKFALVENFWETGFGMPSFTLLGPQIIRFPFILHSSYPHEILHNWWGNSVYVDWRTGNWCEGLTAYLADHLIREGQGRGVAYRRDTLKKYRDYVRAEKDFPLKDFRSRHSAATEAVGYGKSLMVFHMLRIRLGDETFTRGLRTFYRRFKFKVASFSDLAAVFSEVSRQDLRPWFKLWVERTGAPALAMHEVENGAAVVVRQTQKAEPFPLRVPVALSVGSESTARVVMLDMTGRTARLALPEGTRRVDLDPYFDTFRILDRAETPPALGEVFGAAKVTLVLPRDPSIWKPLVKAWSGAQVKAVGEDEIADLPADRAVWVLGRTNRWAAAAQGFLERRKAGPEGGAVRVGAARYPLAGTSFVFAAPHPKNPDLALGWIGCDDPAAVKGLARKLPHYGKYSYLAFSGDEPTNVAKGQWEATHSPLVLHPEQPRAKLPPRRPLARLAPVFDPQKLMAHIRYLASDRMRGRGEGSPELAEAGDYIAKAFAKAGLQPGGNDGGWFLVFTEPGGPAGKPLTLRNVVGVLPGTDPALKDQSVVVGAHYDHLGLGWPDVRKGCEGQIHNGADDNASGVSVLLELAGRLARTEKPQRTIVFVAFSGEEWGLKGSRQYVRSMRRWPVTKAFAMVNLDTVGRLNGKKLMVLGSGTATEWKHIAMGVGYTTGVEAVCVPQDPGGSDQVSFQEAGVPAVQLFSGAHADYHRPTDDIDKIDASGLVKVATFAKETIVYLAERKEPLTSSLRSGGAHKAAPRHGGAGRRVSLGTVPAFGFEGPGVKVDSVVPGSAAQKAGIQSGDILLEIGGAKVVDLRGMSDILKRHAPGDLVRILLRRDGKELAVEARLAAR